MYFLEGVLNSGTVVFPGQRIFLALLLMNKKQESTLWSSCTPFLLSISAKSGKLCFQQRSTLISNCESSKRGLSIRVLINAVENNIIFSVCKIWTGFFGLLPFQYSLLDCRCYFRSQNFVFCTMQKAFRNISILLFFVIDRTLLHWPSLGENRFVKQFDANPTICSIWITASVMVWNQAICLTSL